MRIIRHIHTWYIQNKNDILLGIFAFLALLIAFTAGYCVAKDFTVTPIIIQQIAN